MVQLENFGDLLNDYDDKITEEFRFLAEADDRGLDAYWGVHDDDEESPITFGEVLLHNTLDRVAFGFRNVAVPIFASVKYLEQRWEKFYDKTRVVLQQKKFQRQSERERLTEIKLAEETGSWAA